jgi:AcrR family transcriptional regulator
MSTTNSKDSCSSYHHGDLRNALIIAAAELIEEKGSIDFAMIDAARRAGVSSAAPYRHFKDKEALLQAVAELAFLTISIRGRTAVQDLPLGSSERITAIGKSYIEFVTDHPAFYGLMWGDQGMRRKQLGDPELRHSGFYVLVESVQAWCDKAGLKDFDALELSVKLWAMAHGLASLAMHDSISRFMARADVYTLLESSSNTFLEGLRSHTPGNKRARKR